MPDTASRSVFSADAEIPGDSIEFRFQFLTAVELGFGNGQVAFGFPDQ